MSNCVSINGLENLPVEETLLIHYNITCTGEWHLAQLLTAYRSVCDSEWTVMYPNHQHPLHSDFPITVAQPGQAATFAWNYGGIQGISSENFDAQHSYLVQLSLFEYGCLNSGQTNTGSGSGSGTSGEVTGQTGTSGGGSNPGGGGSNPGGGITQPPNPGGGHPGSNPGGGANPGSTSRPPQPSLGTIPGPPRGGLPPLGGIPTTTPGSGGATGVTGEPSGVYFSGELPLLQEVTPFPTAEPTEDPSPNTPSIGGIGLQNQEPGGVVNQTEYNPTISVLFERPSVNGPGQTQNPNISFTPLVPSSAVPDRNEGENNIQPDLNNITNTNEGSIPGRAAGSLIGSPLLGGEVNKQVNAQSLDSNATMQIQALNTEVTIGEPIILSCYFCPPANMQARGTLSVQDDSKRIEVMSSELIDITPTVPLTLGTSTLSSLYNLGTLVVTFQVYNSDDVLIGVKSIVINNLGINNLGDQFSSKVTQSEELPSSIVNYSYPPISNERYELDLSDGDSRYVLFQSSTAQTGISVVLQTDNDTKNNMSLSVYVPTGIDKTEFGLTEIVTNEHQEPTQGNVKNTPVIKSDKKFMIEGLEVYPHSHNVGVSNVPVDSTYIVAVGISKAINSDGFSSKGYLYLSDNFRMKEAVATGYSDYIIGSMPYLNQKYGLLLHGKTPGAVPSDYSVIETTTNELGAFVFSGITWNEGDHFSIIETKQGILNPFSPPIYTGTYTV